MKGHDTPDRHGDSRHAPPPWAAPSLFQPKPSTHPMGYVQQGKAVPCAADELLTRSAETGEREILLAWVPERENLVTVFEVPSLAESLRARIAKKIRTQMTGSLLLLPLVGGVVFLVKEEPGQREFWLAMLAVFVMAPVLDGWLAMKRLKKDPALCLEEQGQALRFAFWESGMPRWLTSRGLWVLVGVYLLQFVVGHETAYERAGLVKVAARHGDWTRWLTCAFLHAPTPLHIWFNAMAWRSSGRTVEALAGWATLAPVFLLSVIGGSLASLWWKPFGTSIGASGGICGVIGAALVLAIRFRQVLPRGFSRSIWGSIGYTLAMGLMAPNVIDNAAHVGGLLTGALFAWIWIPMGWKSLPLAYHAVHRALGTFSVVVLGAGAIWTLLRMFGRL